MPLLKFEVFCTIKNILYCEWIKYDTLLLIYAFISAYSWIITSFVAYQQCWISITFKWNFVYRNSFKNDCGFWKFTDCESWVTWLWELNVKFCHFLIILDKVIKNYSKNQAFEVIRAGLGLKFSQILRNSLQNWNSRYQNHKNLSVSRNPDSLAFKLT